MDKVSKYSPCHCEPSTRNPPACRYFEIEGQVRNDEKNDVIQYLVKNAVYLAKDPADTNIYKCINVNIRPEVSFGLPTADISMILERNSV